MKNWYFRFVSKGLARDVIVRGLKISTRRYVLIPLWLLLGRVNPILVCHPVWYKERVLDLPSCRTIVMRTRECRPIMLLFFYHNDYHLCGKINIVKGANHSVRKHHIIALLAFSVSSTETASQVRQVLSSLRSSSRSQHISPASLNAPWCVARLATAQLRRDLQPDPSPLPPWLFRSPYVPPS